LTVTPSIRSFDEVLASEGARVIKTPVRAPKANCFAERVVATIRQDLLDWTLVLGRRHLDHILRRYVEYYTGRALTEGSSLQFLTAQRRFQTGFLTKIDKRDVLGGLIHEYHAVAA
jgi:hypothetical protein